MEEKIKYNFEDIVLPKTKFAARFEPTSGKITGVGPIGAFEKDLFKIEIDDDTAIQIIEGKIRIDTCIVNILENRLEITEVKSLFKIDDVLHRIIEKKYVELIEPDLYIKYNVRKKIFIFELSEIFSGTMKTSNKENKRKNIIWNGETSMNFYITDYNDPNVLYQTIELTLSDLQKSSLIFNRNDDVPELFSVYTRRLFKNYVLEYEDN